MERHNFKKLQIWNDAMNLIDKSYSFTGNLPASENYGLTSQMNRSIVSIASNIAEGSSKSSNKHFVQFLETSLGSAFEWETQLIICKRQNYIEEEPYEDLLQDIKSIQRKISNFIKKLKTKKSWLLTPVSCLLIPFSQ